MIKRLKKVWIILPLLFVAALGIILPGRLAHGQGEKDNGQVMMVAEEYYSTGNVAFAKKASEKLTDEQRIQLVTGQWQSSIMAVNKSEAEVSSYEIVEQAKKELLRLNALGENDFIIDSGYGNWYSWVAVPYKAVDITFNTYTAYFWQIEFEKYDRSEKHTVKILENGPIISVD